MRKLKLSEIREFEPCKEAWEFFLKHTNKKMNDKISLIEILDILDSPSNNRNIVADILWLLSKMYYKRIKGARQIFFIALIDISEYFLPIFEKKYPNNDIPRKAIEAIKLFKDRKISKNKLDNIFSEYFLPTNVYSNLYITFIDVYSNNSYISYDKNRWQIEYLRNLLK